jgi:hypothetical protein
MAPEIEVGLVFMNENYSLWWWRMSRPMRDVSKAAGIVLAIVGMVWILQGFDVSFAPQGFMTGDLTWVVLGVVAMLAGGILFWRGRSGPGTSAGSDLGGLREQHSEADHEEGDSGNRRHGGPEDRTT